MTDSQALNAGFVWQVLTRLGEVQILIPVAVLLMLMFAVRPDSRGFALSWMLLTIVATLITTVSKLAFLGWGLGFAEFNFTGVSGHSMFAAAIYPMLMFAVLPRRVWGGSTSALALGGALAIVVGLSRILVGAHSSSEVLAGLLLGGSASALAIARARQTGNYVSTPTATRLHPVVPVLLVVWFLWTPLKLPDSQTHSWVVRLALFLSGHEAPFTRSQLLEPRVNL